MKIGYYFPKTKSSRGNDNMISWDSEEGYSFIQSLFVNGNIELPSRIQHRGDGTLMVSGDFYFDNIENLLEYMSLIRAREIFSKTYSQISQEHYKSILSNIHELKNKTNYFSDELQNKIDSIYQSLDTSLKLIDEEIHREFDGKPGLLDSQIGKIINEEKSINRISSLKVLFESMFRDMYRSGIEIKVRGFKIKNTQWRKRDLYEKLGYNKDVLENNFSLIDDFNQKHRVNHIKSLNNFYDVEQTDKLTDVVYLSLERSVRGDKIGLVLRSKPIKKINYFQHDYMDLLDSKNDFLYFIRVLDSKSRFLIGVSNQQIHEDLSASDICEIQYGILEIQGRDGKPMDENEEQRKKITASLESYRSLPIIEGYKFSENFVKLKNGKKLQLKWATSGSLEEKCKSCNEAPCVCQYIVNWENYSDNYDSAIGLDYFGFSRDRELESGIHPNKIEAGYKIGGEAWDYIPDDIQFNTQNHSRDDGVNWNYYNDQLDMDQQDPEFWNC